MVDTATVSELESWATNAVNLPEHRDNAIHTDLGAQAAGFDRALVAGTTVYAYMTHVPMAAWGLDWLGAGGGELRLRRPVFDGDLVECTPTAEPGEVPVVSACVDGEARATLDAWHLVDAPAARDGDRLPAMEVAIEGSHRDYGQRCGDDLAIYDQHGVVHPVIWVNLANRVFVENLVTGPWIHVRSRIYHQGVASLGAEVVVNPTLIERFDSRAGERALVDMTISADGRPVATIEHEAIIVLPE